MGGDGRENGSSEACDNDTLGSPESGGELCGEKTYRSGGGCDDATCCGGSKLCGDKACRSKGACDGGESGGKTCSCGGGKQCGGDDPCSGADCGEESSNALYSDERQ